jgi:hypothetical protein
MFAIAGLFAGLFGSFIFPFQKKQVFRAHEGVRAPLARERRSGAA